MLNNALPPLEDWEEEVGVSLGQAAIDRFAENLGGPDVLNHAVRVLRDDCSVMTRQQRHHTATAMEEVAVIVLSATRLGKDSPDDPHSTFTAVWSLIRFLDEWALRLGEKDDGLFTVEAAGWRETLTTSSGEHNAALEDAA